jgi:hypothetical protein
MMMIPEFEFSEGVQRRLRFCLDYLSCVQLAESSMGETEKSLGGKSGEQGGWGGIFKCFLVTSALVR